MLGPGFVLYQSFLVFSGQHLAQELQSSTLLPKLSRVMAQGVLPKKEERRKTSGSDEYSVKNFHPSERFRQWRCGEGPIPTYIMQRSQGI